MLLSSRTDLRTFLVRSTPSLVALIGCIVLCSSCGGKAAAPPTSSRVQILGQPTNQITPVGQTATFDVIADGVGTLSYQWEKNGITIPGAASASYVTPPVTATDSDARFSVVVSDSTGSLKSNDVALTIGPRSPRMGDHRFKEVDLAPTLPMIGSSELSGLSSVNFKNALGSPLEVGAGMCGSGGDPRNCAWRFNVAQLTNTSTNYISDRLETLATTIQNANASDLVITSLDERPSNNVFAMSYVSTWPNSGFDLTFHTVQPSALQDLVSQEGLQGRVVTAICMNSKQMVDYTSYGWRSNTQKFEALAVFATHSDVEPQATQMATLGYIITAVGSSGVDDGFILIGTRVQGDSLPRLVAIDREYSDGFATVGAVFDANGNTIIGEK